MIEPSPEYRRGILEVEGQSLLAKGWRPQYQILPRYTHKKKGEEDYQENKG